MLVDRYVYTYTCKYRCVYLAIWHERFDGGNDDKRAAASDTKIYI